MEIDGRALVFGTRGISGHASMTRLSQQTTGGKGLGCTVRLAIRIDLLIRRHKCSLVDSPAAGRAATNSTTPRDCVAVASVDVIKAG